MSWLWLMWLACSPAPAPADAPAAEAAPVERAPAELPEGWLEAVVGTSHADQPLPMVVMVHGLGDRPQSMLRVMAELPGPARVIAPRAPDAWHDGWSWFPTLSSGDEAVLAEEMAGTADRFVAHLQAAAAARPTVGRPILAGFSQGGMLSVTVAVHHPEAIALAVPVAGWLPEPLWPETGPPAGAPSVRMLHGLDDTVLPFERTSDGVGAMRTLGWDVSMQAFPGVAHQVPLQVRRSLYREVQAGIAAAQGGAP